MLSGAGQNTTDLSRFERGNPVMPGAYRVDVYLNNEWVGRRDVQFAAPSPDASALPCVTPELLRMMSLPRDKLSVDAQAALADGTCTDLTALIPGSTIKFDQSELRLDATVPQAWLGYRPRGYVSPENWDAGVAAMLLNYNFNAYHSTNAGISQTNAYLGLNLGVNVGLWQLREDANLTWQSAAAGQPSRRQWQSIDTYLRRALPSWRAQLTVGDAYTSGDMFDSIRIRGVNVGTDDRMLPDSLRGYAPTVRGVADTNARVTVRQNGVQLYETTVSPGPFELNDLYATGYGGDLQVTVTEADGRVKTFSVPYASVPQLLRPGVMRFNIAAGAVNDVSMEHSPALLQATIQRGMTNMVTGYGGIVGSTGYASALVGAALNTRYGALAMDITGARTSIPGQSSMTGESVRLSYSKIIPSTQTSLSVATYRYSTSGFLGLRDALLARDYARGGLYAAGTDPQLLANLDSFDPYQANVLNAAQRRVLLGYDTVNPATNQLYRQRSRFDLSLNQQLNGHGAIYASASALDYWNKTRTDVQFQVGYNNSFKRLGYSVSASRVRDSLGHYGNQYFINFTLPLGHTPHSPNLTANLSRDASGDMLEQAAVNGIAGHDNQFSYGANASHGDSAGTAGSLYGGYRSSYAQLNASYGSGSGYSQASFSANGGVVAYPGGISFGQQIGDSVGIVVAPDAAGAQVSSTPGLRVDRSGHALVPFLTPYALNTVELNPKGLPLDVQLEETSAQSAPYAGAVVLLKFKTSSGRSMIVKATQADGQAVPFGATVTDEKGQMLGVVGQAGQILVRGVNDAGELSVRWNDDDGTAHGCSFPYAMKARKKGDGTAVAFEQLEAACKPVAMARSGT